MCQRYASLPDAGAILDQDAGLLKRMGTLSNIYEIVGKVQSMQGAQIHKLTISERHMIQWLMDEEVWQM